MTARQKIICAICIGVMQAAVIMGGVGLAALAGCKSSATVTLPQLPAWQQPAGEAHTFTTQQVRLEVARVLPGVPVYASDSTYAPISHEWLTAYCSWTWQAAKAAGVTYTPETFDCEDFSTLFTSLANLAASRARAPVRAAPLIARIVVQLPAGRHELVGVCTDRGLYVVEPQPDAGPFRITPLTDYHAGRILWIILGDYSP